MDKFVGCKISPEKKNEKKQVESKNLKKSRKKTTEKKKRKQNANTHFSTFQAFFLFPVFYSCATQSFTSKTKLRSESKQKKKSYTHNNENTLTGKKNKTNQTVVGRTDKANNKEAK